MLVPAPMSEAGRRPSPRCLERSRSGRSRRRTTRRSTRAVAPARSRRRATRWSGSSSSARGARARPARTPGAPTTSSWSSRTTGAFYEALRRAGLTGKRPALMALVSGWLPPTQCSLRFEAEGVHVKAAVIRLDTCRRETSPGRRDHFCIGRLCQPTRILHCARRGGARAPPGGPRVAPPGDVAAGRGPGCLRASTRRPTVAPPCARRCGGRCGRSPPAAPTPCGRRRKASRCRCFEALLGELAERGEVVGRPRRAGRFAPARPVGRAERLRLRRRTSVARSCGPPPAG